MLLKYIIDDCTDKYAEIHDLIPFDDMSQMLEYFKQMKNSTESIDAEDKIYEDKKMLKLKESANQIAICYTQCFKHILIV